MNGYFRASSTTPARLWLMTAVGPPPCATAALPSSRNIMSSFEEARRRVYHRRRAGLLVWRPDRLDRDRLRRVRVEHDHLVLAGPQPGRRTVEPALRANVPVPPQIVPVHEDDALPVAGRVDVGVGRLRNAEPPAEEQARPCGVD